MDVIYHLKPNELNADFFKVLQETFMGKEIAVTVSEITGTTEYLLSNEENRRRLLNAIDDIKNERYNHTMTLEEMEAMIQ
jgi:hypothetical protein